jgi:SAM-dependent methyltransferase
VVQTPPLAENVTTIDEAIRTLRLDPQYADLVRDAYLGRDVADSIERFARSAEFEEVRRLIGDRIAGATVLDLGAGTGIASAAFKLAGAGHVIAVEPDESEEVGRGAMARADLDVEVVAAYGESIPVPTDSVDIAYARQVLHHARDLDLLIAEVARVLRPGGLLVACREHVVSNDEELQSFLAAHPIHRLAGGENAFPLAAYTSAIERSGLRVQAVLGPWDTVINAFPTVRSTAELRALAQDRLVRRFGAAGAIAARVPGVQAAIRRRIERPVPGRLYSFVATKP